MSSPGSSLGFYPEGRALGVGQGPLASLLQMLCGNYQPDACSLAHSCSSCAFTTSLAFLRGLLGRSLSPLIFWAGASSALFSQPIPICFRSFWSVVGFFNCFLALWSFHPFTNIFSVLLVGLWKGRGREVGMLCVWSGLHLKSPSSLFTWSVWAISYMCRSY